MKLKIKCDEGQTIADATVTDDGKTAIITVEDVAQPQPAAQGLDCEVILADIDIGMDSRADHNDYKSASTWYHDPSDFDGVVSYGCEVVGYNNDAQARHVWIVEQGSWDRVAEMVIPAHTPPSLLRFDNSFTPKQWPCNYMIEMEKTSSYQNLVTYAVRPYVVQHGATRTRVCVPLLGVYNDWHGWVQQAAAVAFGPEVPTEELPVWYRDNSLFAPLPLAWTLEVVAAGSGVVGLCAGNGSLITTAAPEVQDPMLFATQMSGSDFADKTSYRLAATPSAGKRLEVYRAAMYIKLGPRLTRVYTVRRISRYNLSATNAIYLPTHFDPARFSHPKCSLEVCGEASLGSNWTAQLRALGDANGAGVQGQTVCGVGLSQSVRTPAVELPSGNYSCALVGKVGTGVLTQACLGILVSV
jgi:hypothetical protein